MNFYRSNVFWTLSAIALPALLIAGYYGFKVMTSVYKQDLGNGVIIYADNFVKTGKWVFDCNNSRLISREPLPAPISVLEGTGQLTIGDMYTLEDADREQADAAIRAITGIEGWYKNLRYRYSSLNESSNLNVHNFDLLARHDGRQWALKVRQRLDYQGESSFKTTAVPYAPETYVDYAKALQAALLSCPAPQ